jgi:hypothetical protein
MNSIADDTLEANIEFHAEVITRLTDELNDTDPDNEQALRRIRSDINHCERELAAMVTAQQTGERIPDLTPAPSMRNKPMAPARRWSKYSRYRRR